MDTTRVGPRRCKSTKKADMRQSSFAGRFASWTRPCRAESKQEELHRMDSTRVAGAMLMREKKKTDDQQRKGL